jgi:hypothetical protein
MRIRNTDARLEAIRGHVLTLHKRFNRRFDPDGDSSDAIILGDYVNALKNVPNHELKKLFEGARLTARFPHAGMIASFYSNHDTSTASMVVTEPFTPEFRTFLQEVSCKAQILWAETKNINYRKMFECADQSDYPPQRELFRKLPTLDAKAAFVFWLDSSGIPKDVILEVCK